jgi:predicted outer membrane repeat protein
MILSALKNLSDAVFGRKAANVPDFRPPLRRSRLALQELEARTVPATFYVTNTSDSGAGSLRQAIIDSNSVAGPVVNNIFFSLSGTGGGMLELETPLAPFTNHVNMSAIGTTPGIAITISENAPARFRAFDNLYAAYVVNISNVDLYQCGSSDLGGGIRNNGTMHLNDVYMYGCGGTLGGGIYNTGFLEVENSHFQMCAAQSGGAIYSTGNPSAHTVVVRNTNFIENYAVYDGGAIHSVGGNATLHVYDSLFDFNRAELGAGGAITHGFGQIILLDCLIQNNTSKSDAAGVNITETVNSVINSDIVLNDAFLGTYSGLFVSGFNVNLTVNLTRIHDNWGSDTNL